MTVDQFIRWEPLKWWIYKESGNWYLSTPAGQPADFCQSFSSFEKLQAFINGGCK